MKKERNYSLDFLKIIATILIVWHHYQQILEIKFDKINFFYGKFYFGYLVELFFVLSVFFMYSYINKIEQGLSFKDFFIKRVSRLLPLISIAVIVYEIIIVIYPKVFNLLFLEQTLDIFGSFISILGIQAGWFFKNPMINNPMWYVSVLILCYILFYILVKFNKKNNITIKFIVMVLLGIIIQRTRLELPFFNSYTARGYYSFFFGALFSIYFNNYKLKNSIKIVSLAVAIIIPFFILGDNKIIIKLTKYILPFLYYPSLIIILNFDVLKNKIFSNKGKVLNYIGEVSFNVYVWHVCGVLLLNIINKYYNLNINLSTYKIMFIFTFFLYIWGIISYHLIEKPLRKIL